MKNLFSLFLIFTPISIAFAQVDMAKLDNYIQQSLEEWEVPGFAFAIVKDGEVVHLKGYGVRELGKSDPVNTQTIFNIGSTTKAITAAAMGMLVDEGKVDWDDKVIEHLPNFQLYDPYATRELRVRDLFTHNAGLGNADFLWYGNQKLSPEEILHRMRIVKPAYPFRGGYTYQNIMYLAAGKVIEAVSGMTWEDFVQKHIFEPLGMKNSYASLELSQVEKNRSKPHHRDENGKIVTIENISADPIAPAGAIWASIEDMSKWVQFMLDSAKVNGERLLKPETYAELIEPQIVIPQDQFYPTTQLTKPHWTTYALGWFQHDYNGRFVTFHTGSLPGEIAIIGLIPDEQLGIYALGNLDHAEVRHALMYKTFDVFAGIENGRDWSTDLKNLYQKLGEREERATEEWKQKRVPDTEPTLALSNYVGNYAHPLYGKFEVKLENEQLRIASDMATVHLKHWHYNTFYGKWNDLVWLSDSYFNFVIDAEGKASMLQAGGVTYRRRSN